MTTSEIKEILKMRMAVYAAGVKANAWKSIDAAGAADMMTYLFPKSGKLAYYHLIIEHMRACHDIFTGGVYYLFKMPVQVEKDIMDFLRKDDVNLVSFQNNADEYLAEMDTIPTDHSISIVNIGSFSMQNIMIMLRLCAAHYRYSFENNIESYPYFE